MKNLLYILFISTALLSCKKEAYERFDGTYDVKSTGSINYFIGDTTFVDEPGMAVIKKGDNSDEVFIYVETNFVTSIAPLGVSAKAKVEGNKYTLIQQDLSITLDLDLGLGFPLPPLAFKVNGSGTLSDDGEILTSTIIFSGGITGTMTCVGTRR